MTSLAQCPIDGLLVGCACLLIARMLGIDSCKYSLLGTRNVGTLSPQLLSTEVGKACGDVPALPLDART